MINEREFQKLMQRTARLESLVPQLMQPKSSPRLIMPGPMPWVVYEATITNWQEGFDYDYGASVWSIIDGDESAAGVKRDNTTSELRTTGDCVLLVSYYCEFLLQSGANRLFTANQRLEWVSNHSYDNSMIIRGSITPSAWFSSTLGNFAVDTAINAGAHTYLTGDVGANNEFFQMPGILAKRVSTTGTPTSLTADGKVIVQVIKIA